MDVKKYEKFKTKTFIKKDKFIKVNYINRYHRKYNQNEENPLFGEFSKLINGIQKNNTKSMEDLSKILIDLIPKNSVVVPIVSKYSSNRIYYSLVNLFTNYLSNSGQSININLGIKRKDYLNDLKLTYMEKIDIESLVVNHKCIQSIYNQNVILFTDVATNNLNMFFSYENALKKFRPKSIQFYALGFYVED